MSRLATLGLGVYALIPDYLDRCPLCTGQNCSVRHGLYHRRVVLADGTTIHRFPIPRFRCQAKGPRRPTGVTFSVLPTDLLPRRAFSLASVLGILDLFVQSQRSIREVLDQLAELFSQGPWYPEPTTLYRLLHLFDRAYFRLRISRLLSGPPPSQKPRERVRTLLSTFSRLNRGSPLVLTYHRHRFPHTLFSAADR